MAARLQRRPSDGGRECAVLPVRLSDVSRPVRPASADGSIYIELSNARIEIHGAADAVSLGIVLECLAQ